MKKQLMLMMSLITLLAGCRSYPVPEGAVAVKPFDKDKYLGTWYEIARFDFRFEKDLNNTTAHYSLNEDGTIKVVNRGFNYVKGQWKESVGKAKFVDATDEARLKVSFFGPFYGGYNVIALDEAYTYALVAGSSLDYLWILARTKTIPQEVRDRYVQFAQSIGFDTGKLIWVEHTP
ncbi:MAG: lipocalin [Paludibacter sp. 47-17]|nr:MAG: lipocalin [Paludibacter sp. 47-17]